MLDNVYWLGHAGIRIDASKRIYLDPYRIACDDPADVILITHDHYDHFSPGDIEKISGEKTILVKPGLARDDLDLDQRILSPGEELEVLEISIRTVPAYNPEKRYHPQGSHYVGYVFRVDGVVYYHAGDTDLIPEMEQIQCDVAFLPIGGNFTMDAREAAKAADLIRPKVAIPVHWGSIVGSYQDAETFSKLCSCEVHILERLS